MRSNVQKPGIRALLAGCALLVSAPLPAASAQLMEAADGGQIIGQISVKETNRIGLVDDRIREVFKSDGEFTIETDGKRGDIYLRTVSNTAGGSLNFFVTSEKGHTYQFLLTPKDVPAEQILVRNPEMSTGANRPSPKEAGPMQKAVTGLIELMAAGGLDDAYRLDTKNAAFRIGENLMVTRQARYLGAVYKGEVFQVQNKTADPLELTETVFERRGVVAVSMSSNRIEPEAFITVYVVVQEGYDG